MSTETPGRVLVAEVVCGPCGNAVIGRFWRHPGSLRFAALRHHKDDPNQELFRPFPLTGPAWEPEQVKATCRRCNAIRTFDASDELPRVQAVKVRTEPIRIRAY